MKKPSDQSRIAAAVSWICNEVMDMESASGWNEEYASVTEFKHRLDEGATLAHKDLDLGWAFWMENEQQQQQQQQILTLLQTLRFGDFYRNHHMLQIWAVAKVEEGRRHHLSASLRPFRVGELNKGICCYRKLCKGYEYVVDVEGDQEQLQLHLIGGVGRAYRNQQPESTPDLRLYSTREFPMRDEAARCGFRAYMALPLFDSCSNHCFGVLEILSRYSTMNTNLLPALDQALQVAGLRSTHTSTFTAKLYQYQYKQHPETEISGMLEFAMAAVPRLYLALVWVPCKQCASTNLRCMEIASFISCKSRKFNQWEDIDEDVHDYLQACKLHNLQKDAASFHSNLCGLSSISENALAHYAQKSRMSHSFTVSLQNSNHLYVIQFHLLQPKLREDAYGADDSVDLLLRMMEVNLRSFKLVPGQPRQSSAIECGLIESLQVMKSYNEHFWEWNFTALLETFDLCCLRPSSGFLRMQGWVFRRPGGERLIGENGRQFKQRIEDFMKRIAVMPWKHYKWIVQFWVPKMGMRGRCFLGTSYQPYALGRLTKGLASFRKKCMKHYYFINDEVEEEDLGPPGRVFKNRHPEFTPDLFCYTQKEFHIRNYALRCFGQGYFALPIFDDEHNHKCVGVLEFLGFQYSDLEDIGRALQAAKLCSTHIDFRSRFIIDEQFSANEQAVNSIDYRKEALGELRNALLRMRLDIPQFYMANVWVLSGECVTSTTSNSSCMELALCSNQLEKFMPTDQVHWIHVQKKKGMVGMVLASEDKSCFCRNLCEFSIADHPLSHYDRNDRRDACFTICLQSVHTNELLYLLECYLYQRPATYEYVRSFLNSLLPLMKHELKSFKMASGNELGEGLVVEVIEFSDANKLYSSESEQATENPIKFKSVQYSQQEHQHAGEQLTDEACSDAASCSNRRERGKRKTDLNHSLEVLGAHFGKKLTDVEEELGIGKSTIKRACRGYGIDRWPSSKKSLSVFEKDCAIGFQQDMLPSSGSCQPFDASLHLNVKHTKKEEKVMIKLKYEEDIIKFELYLSLGLANLMEAVAKRINLEMGTFKLKYLDEDYEILLANDDDLQLCQKSQITMGRPYIRLLVC